jgi:uncharacterized Zn finger protein
VKGGIRAQSKKGGFGESWWAKRWIDVLESYHIGERMSRGRRYARQGQVISIDIEKGIVRAKVQGSRAKPYTVTMELATVSSDSLKRLEQEIAGRILIGAKLQVGQMPPQLEEIFQGADAPLFPRKYKDLRTTCSCPDWSNPCKHIAAVCFLLAEEFDRDPFLILKWRGISREELLSCVSGAPGEDGIQKGKKSVTKERAGKRKKDAVPEDTRDDQEVTSEPLSSDPDQFWGRKRTIEESDITISIPSLHAALPARLGKFPFWRGRENLQDCMEEIYRTASLFAVDAMSGEMAVRQKPPSKKAGTRRG